MSCSGDHHHFTGRATACDCTRSTSNLASGGLPYPSWILDETSRYGTRYSNFAQATDPKTGRICVVREYLPGTVPDPLVQRRRFIATAKSLRSTVPPAQRLLFAYTRNGRCYTVADPLLGTPIFHLTLPGRTTESAAFSRLAALLDALHQLHTSGAAAGPLFHANLRPETILAANPASDAPLELPFSLYLENLLHEHPLPPEHFQAQDLLAAADAALTLTQGFGTPADRAARLNRISDPLLGATLEYLYGIHSTRPNTAKAARDYLALLQAAAYANDPNLFTQARALSPSPRLLRLATPPPPPPPTPRPSPPPPSFRPHPAPAAIPHQPPPFQPPPYAPVTPASAANKAVAQPSQPTHKRRTGCGGCLLTLLLAVLVIAAIAVVLLNRPKTSTNLDFSASPNPAPRRARVELHWTSSGFERLQLDGKDVDPNGSLYLLASAAHHYTLTGTRPDGSREIRTLDLAVLNRRPAKPSPGTPSGASAEPTDSNPDVPVVDLKQVNTALEQWRDAMLSNDPNREAASYAPQIDRYFLQSNVTQGYVRRYLSHVRDEGTTFAEYNISNLLTIPEPDGSVEARFYKEVSFDTPAGPKHQATHSVLHLRELDGAWKITSERDFHGRIPNP